MLSGSLRREKDARDNENCDGRRSQRPAECQSTLAYRFIEEVAHGRADGTRAIDGASPSAVSRSGPSASVVYRAASSIPGANLTGSWSGPAFCDQFF